MKTLLPLLLIAATALAAEKAPDELALLDTRELHNRGTLRLQQGDLVGAEEALKASLARNDDVLRLPALHNLGHVRFGRGKVALGGKTVGDVTELSIARSYLEASDADISDMQDQIEIIDKAKADGKEPDYIPAVSALGGGIGTYRTVKKLIPKEEAMVAKRAGVIASWVRSVGDFRSAREGAEKRMTEQEARSSLESLKGEFGRKMPTSDKPGNGPGGNKPSSEAKKKDY